MSGNPLGHEPDRSVNRGEEGRRENGPFSLPQRRLDVAASQLVGRGGERGTKDNPSMVNSFS